MPVTPRRFRAFVDAMPEDGTTASPASPVPAGGSAQPATTLPGVPDPTRLNAWQLSLAAVLDSLLDGLRQAKSDDNDLHAEGTALRAAVCAPLGRAFSVGLREWRWRPSRRYQDLSVAVLAYRAAVLPRLPAGAVAAYVPELRSEVRRLVPTTDPLYERYSTLLESAGRGELSGAPSVTGQPTPPVTVPAQCAPEPTDRLT